MEAMIKKMNRRKSQSGVRFAITDYGNKTGIRKEQANSITGNRIVIDFRVV